MIDRLLQNVIQKKIFMGKVILVIGPRQSGKTTLLRIIERQARENVLYLNCKGLYSFIR